jgi:hypothetical protein
LVVHSAGLNVTDKPRWTYMVIRQSRGFLLE